MTATFSEIESETPSVSITFDTSNSDTCYSMDIIPDTRRGYSVVEITEYKVYGGDINQYTSEDRKYVSAIETSEEQEDDTGVVHTIITKTISFIPLVTVTKKKFALNLGSAYIASNGMYINCGNAGELPTQYVIMARDFSGNKIGKLKYGYMSVPLNIDDDLDANYYAVLQNEINTQRRVIGLSDLDVNEVPHKTIDDYDWSYMAYFKLSSETGIPTFEKDEYGNEDKDGYDWPVSLEVLPPGTLSGEDGEVFNRVYEIQEKVYADHVDFPEGDYPGKKEDGEAKNTVWIDKASMAASISANDNVDDWKNLIYKPSDHTTYDSSVPPRMRESVEKLISKTTFLDDSYL